jgi:hypothetical protein
MAETAAGRSDHAGNAKLPIGWSQKANREIGVPGYPSRATERPRHHNSLTPT